MSDSTTLPEEDLRSVLERMERRLEALQARIEVLEGAASPAPETASPSYPAPSSSPPMDLELLTAISAAVAAYLGEEPRIRSIRLVRSSAWAQQGRATIQASYSVSPPAQSTPPASR